MSGSRLRDRGSRGDVAGALGHRHQRGTRAGGRGRGHAGAAAPVGDDQAAAAQLRQRGRHRRGADAGLGGERPYRRQPLTRRQPPVADRQLDLLDEAGGRPRTDPVLFRDSQVLYYYKLRRHDTATAGDPTTNDPPSERVRLRRKRERGHYDREVIDAILDEALFAHLGITDEHGQPFVIPTLHARRDGVVYCHGSLGLAHDQGAVGGRPGVPDGVADRRAGAGALGDAPLRQLPLGDAARSGARGDRARREAGGAGGDRRAHRPGPLAGGARAERQRAGGHRGRVASRSRRPRRRSAAAARSTTSPTSSATVWAGVLPLASAVGTPAARRRCSTPRSRCPPT